MQAPADPLCFLLFAEESNTQDQRTDPITVPVLARGSQHAPAQFRLKKASSVGAVCGNGISFINKVDLLVIDGINVEYKQDPCQSFQNARPAWWGWIADLSEAH